MFLQKSSLLILLLVTLFIGDLNAQNRITDSDAAREVFEEVDRRRASVTTEVSTLEMVIYDSRDRSRSRTLRSYSYSEGETTNSLLLFEAPGNVRGTGFLNINEDGNEVQRLYLPSVGRVQTISASERGDRFMGSDFTFEDLGSQDPDNFSFEWIETHDDHYLIGATRTDNSQYARMDFKIGRESYALEQVDYYDDAGNKIKQLIAEQINNVYGELWSPAKMTMYDLKENRRTELSWQNRSFNTDIPDWRFTERGLQRGL
jgi:hypothetical protein